jgi:hypothetical protein
MPFPKPREQMMSPAAATKLNGHLLEWPVKKVTRSFRVYVVEPANYDPPRHAAIFNGTLTALSTSKPTLLDQYGGIRNLPVGEQFDLVTFPEAFLPADDLIESLKQISRFESFGCVHVGLRPSASTNTHLFTAAQLDSLITTLSAIPAINGDDIEPFKAWLTTQGRDLPFNVGCLFAIDANSELRVCLHPKMVRSKYEVSPLSERHMKEANLLTLITLLPEDKVFFSVTLQPLLCSDALQLDTDHPGQLPLDGVNTGAGCFPHAPPDHIDIVSIATCTPQPESAGADETRYRQWHKDFRNTFERVGNDGILARHHHSIFVLSNFHSLPPGPHGLASSSYGGLSGAFIPVPLGDEDLPQYAQMSSFGKKRESAGDDNTWSIPNNKVDLSRSTRGYIAQLDPYGEDITAAKMFGFTITRFPRDAPRWKSQAGLVDFRLRTAIYDDDQNAVKFERREE